MSVTRVPLQRSPSLPALMDVIGMWEQWVQVISYRALAGRLWLRSVGSCRRAPASGVNAGIAGSTLLTGKAQRHRRRSLRDHQAALGAVLQGHSNAHLAQDQCLGCGPDAAAWRSLSQRLDHHHLAAAALGAWRARLACRCCVATSGFMLLCRNSKTWNARRAGVYTMDTRGVSMNDSGFRIRVDDTLRAEFIAACRRRDRTAAQVLRDFMRQFVDEQEATTQRDLFVQSADVESSTNQ